jgi:hypothetical protein
MFTPAKLLMLMGIGKNLVGWVNRVIGATYNAGGISAPSVSAYSYDPATYTVTLTTSAFYGIGYKFNAIPGQRCCASNTPISIGTRRYSINWYDANNNYLGSVPVDSTDYVSGVAPANTTYGIVCFAYSASGTYSYRNVQVETDVSTPTAFEQFEG